MRVERESIKVCRKLASVSEHYDMQRLLPYLEKYSDREDIYFTILDGEYVLVRGECFFGLNKDDIALLKDEFIKEGCILEEKLSSVKSGKILNYFIDRYNISYRDFKNNMWTGLSVQYIISYADFRVNQGHQFVIRYNKSRDELNIGYLEIK